MTSIIKNPVYHPYRMTKQPEPKMTRSEYSQKHSTKKVALNSPKKETSSESSFLCTKTKEPEFNQVKEREKRRTQFSNWIGCPLRLNQGGEVQAGFEELRQN